MALLSFDKPERQSYLRIHLINVQALSTNLLLIEIKRRRQIVSVSSWLTEKTNEKTTISKNILIICY